MSEAQLPDWRDHFAQSYHVKTRVAAMHVVCEARFIPLGCQVPQNVLPDDLAGGPQAVALLPASARGLLLLIREAVTACSRVFR
jgi:hypothetical protein